MKRPLFGGARLRAAMLAMAGACILLIHAGQAQSVPTNMALLQHLAADCLSEVPAQEDTVVVENPDSLPYLASSVTSALQENGRIVYMGEGTQFSRPALSWIVEVATVDYARARSKTVQRTVRLQLQYLLVGVDGRVLANGPCGQSYTDVVPRDELAALETAAYPETQAEPPEARWMRRYVEPVVLAVATGLAAFLFFNLRSDRADT